MKIKSLQDYLTNRLVTLEDRVRKLEADLVLSRSIDDDLQKTIAKRDETIANLRKELNEERNRMRDALDAEIERRGREAVFADAFVTPDSAFSDGGHIPFDEWAHDALFPLGFPKEMLPADVMLAEFRPELEREYQELLSGRNDRQEACYD